MTEQEVLEALGRLDRAGIEWWIDGGWGVDTLLGEVTRAHDDLDLAVRREAIDRLPEVFPEYARVNEHEWPSAYVLRDDEGYGSTSTRSSSTTSGMAGRRHSGAASYSGPREALSARGRIGGREVRCTSVEFQLE